MFVLAAAWVKSIYIANLSCFLMLMLIPVVPSHFFAPEELHVRIIWSQHDHKIRAPTYWPTFSNYKD